MKKEREKGSERGARVEDSRDKEKGGRRDGAGEKQKRESALGTEGMAGRFFKNEMPDFVEKTEVVGGDCPKTPDLYTGSLGTTFLLFKKYLVTKDRRDLYLSGDIVKARDSASKGSPFVTFIYGWAGVCAQGTVLAKQPGDRRLLQHYLNSFKEDTHKDEESRVRDDACEALYNIAMGRRNGGIGMSFTAAAAWSKIG
ncbi:hypothetical protein KSP40_PGU020250 [Platanthera guangdongensis]|uniref:Uncharacterized protein n=1 Tax=Platanthera guangdongensis TaxID=2320717 RepID=A0ABR2M038_9ASPA